MTGRVKKERDHFEPAIHGGVLDLCNWEFKKDGILSLNGDWAFYWNQFLDGSDFAMIKPIAPPGRIFVPGIWNRYKIQGEEIGGLGYATYRLVTWRCRDDDPSKRLTFRLF